MKNNTNAVVIEEIRKQFSHDKQIMNDLELFLKTKVPKLIQEYCKDKPDGEID